MIDRPARNELSQLIRQMAAGTITVEDFFDDGYEITRASRDIGVQVAYEVASEICFDEAPSSCRFRGRHRLPENTRRELVQTAVFLRSDLTYNWPELDGYSDARDRLLCWLVGLCASAGLVLVMLPLIAVPLLLLAAAIYFCSKPRQARRQQRWINRLNQIGDYDVWPFRYREDFDQARRQPWLLTGACQLERSVGTD